MKFNKPVQLKKLSDEEGLLFRLKHISMWSFLKWLLIVLTVLYVGTATGIKLAQDIKGIHVSYNLYITLNSDGLLRPIK